MSEEEAYKPADLVRWFELQQQLAKLGEEEMLLRVRIFKHHFPKPDEGVNHSPLADGYQLNGTYKINRNVDQAALVQLTPTLLKAEIPVDTIFKTKRELAVSEYRKYEDDSKKEQRTLIDQCLVIKPGAPVLQIVLPKRR